MQKLLIVFVSAVTLLGLVAPSSAYAVLDPTRRDDGRYPRPSHHFKHKHHGQHEERDSLTHDLSQLPPARRGHAEHPQPSHHFIHKHHGHGDDDDQDDDDKGHKHQERNSDRLARGLPPLPPARRDSAKHPHPSHYFKHKHLGHGDDDDQGDKHQERNSDRLARGLPPLPPVRRDSAPHPQPSHRFKHKHQGDGNGPDNRIEIRDTKGNSLGYLTDFTGSGQDLSVNYHPGAHTLSFHGDNLGDAHFLGAYVSKTDLRSNSPDFVPLTNVATHNHQANVGIWSLDGNKLTATWENSDGTTAPVRLCLNNAVVLAGTCPPGYKEVYFYL